MNKRQKKKRIRLNNKKLIKEFPFLAIKNAWTGKVDKNYHFDVTWLDDMPYGWRKRFGIELCKDLKKALVKANYLKDYQIIQVKEKFGTLRWYDNGSSEECHQILFDYEYISGHICIECGKLDTPMIDDGWVSPICEDCYNKRINKYNKRFPDIKIVAYKDVICDSSPMGTSYKTTRFSNEGKIITENDVTYILERIK